jgi:hypothetical protein
MIYPGHFKKVTAYMQQILRKWMLVIIKPVNQGTLINFVKGFIPGATIFSEKYWVWNGVHSAS